MESVKVVSSARATRERVSPVVEPVLKRSFDIALSATALLCVAPILIVAMIAIILDSPGSPIFTQTRVGRNGRLFQIFKLRTMFVGTDSLDFKTRSEDGRLTRVGIWLRRLNLDELPQLVNILLGDMSVIGPRPLSLAETNFLTGAGGFSSEYPGLIPTFRPGLVGLEQVNRSKNLKYAERFDYNSQYESNWTAFLDIEILIKAIYLCGPVCAVVTSGAVFLMLFLMLLH